MLYLMKVKVTALIPDELVDEVNAQAQGKNLTESLVIALNVHYFSAIKSELQMVFERGRAA